jgi:hypothetical protein
MEIEPLSDIFYRRHKVAIDRSGMMEYCMRENQGKILSCEFFDSCIPQAFRKLCDGAGVKKGIPE